MKFRKTETTAAKLTKTHTANAKTTSVSMSMSFEEAETKKQRHSAALPKRQTASTCHTKRAMGQQPKHS